MTDQISIHMFFQAMFQVAGVHFRWVMNIVIGVLATINKERLYRMSGAGEKAALRRQAKEARASLSPEERRKRSERICRAAVRVLEEKFSRAEHGPFALFSYMPYATEVDVTDVIRWCWAEGITVVAPKTVRGERAMTLHVIRSFDDLESGAYGIREPVLSAPQLEREADIRAVLVPGLAFDPAGGRLGYGGGYYDTFFSRFRAATGQDPLKLAPAFDLQLIPRVPMDEHDVRMDLIVTESRIFAPGNRKSPANGEDSFCPSESGI